MRILAPAILSISLLAACGPKPTPVVPTPVSSEEQGRLQAAIVGNWKCTHTKVGEDEKKDQPLEVLYTFKSDGSYHLHIGGSILIPVDKDYQFKLDGRNVVTNSPHGTYRVDDLSGNTMTLFNYDASTAWYLTRN
jgi:hypothetical protein